MRIAKGRFRYVVLAIGLFVVSPLWSSAATPGQAEGMEDSSADSSGDPAIAVASQVHSIVTSSGPRLRKEKRVSEVVRKGVLTAVDPISEPELATRTAVAIAAACAETAPTYVEIIARAAAFAEPIRGLEGASSRIRSAAYASAKQAKSDATGTTASTSTRDSAPGGEFSAPAGSRVRVTHHDSGEIETSRGESNSDFSAPNLSMGDNANIRFGLAARVTYDSNIFLRNGHKKGENGSTVDQSEISETIRSVIPSVELAFGRNSLAHGSLGYTLAFTDYVREAANSTTFGTGTGSFEYQGTKISTNINASYQQSNEATLFTAGVPELVKRTEISTVADVEAQLSAKTSLQTGISDQYTKYKRPGLVGSNNITWPVKVFVQATPKLAVSGGVSFGQVKPNGQISAPSGSAPQTTASFNKSLDVYYNLGLRGTISEKLTANVSAGYRTRSVDNRSQEHLWGFNGSLDFFPTVKSSFALSLSRDFGVGAGGESTEDTGIDLKFSTAPTLHWQYSAGIGWRHVNYGRPLFVSGAPDTSTERSDSYWNITLSASYLFTSWLSLAGNVLHRQNASSQDFYDFSDTIASITLALQY